ncbi:MAG TPA: hypothetical protein VHP33_33395 [Polyangiaceae bacterium]|nr:hypothetical protein [Polyangiaceae bacterium]
MRWLAGQRNILRSRPKCCENYLVVSHRERRITVHSRTSDGGWETRVAIGGGKLTLTSLASELHVDGIYRASAIA